MRWALILAFMATIFLVAWESLTGQSSESSLVRGIICILGRRFGLKRWAPSPCTTQLLLQLVNLMLHVSLILCMGDMTLPRDWLLLVCVVCTLPSRFPLRWGFTAELLRWEPLDSAWCRLTLPWCGPIVDWCEPDSSISSAKSKSLSDQIKLFPQTTPIIRTIFVLDSKTRLDSGPTSPNNEFVERGRKN